MPILENIPLQSLNTFGIAAHARYFAVFSGTEELKELLDTCRKPVSLVLGGGSNLLFTKDVDGLVLKNEIPGISVLHEDSDHVYLRAGAGIVWHELVQYCIARNWGGLENLSLIPGRVGASPMQNIGAYGAELADVFWDLEAFHLQEKKVQTFTGNDCAFGYRDSVFKNRYRNQFAILNVTFRLKKKPVFNIRYGAIEQELEKMGVTALSVKAISDAVIRIRQSKLPDPSKLPNAGSFFKNPEVSPEKYGQLRAAFPDLVGYPLLSGQVKLAAGWLIEHTGPEPGTSWKGFRIGDAGCHAQQALVLVNHGTASGKDIFSLSEAIAASVWNKFGVKLEKEVNIL